MGRIVNDAVTKPSQDPEASILTYTLRRCSVVKSDTYIACFISFLNSFNLKIRLISDIVEKHSNEVPQRDWLTNKNVNKQTFFQKCICSLAQYTNKNRICIPISAHLQNRPSQFMAYNVLWDITKMKRVSVKMQEVKTANEAAFSRDHTTFVMCDAWNNVCRPFNLQNWYKTYRTIANL